MSKKVLGYPHCIKLFYLLVIIHFISGIKLISKSSILIGLWKNLPLWPRIAMRQVFSSSMRILLLTKFTVSEYFWLVLWLSFSLSFLRKQEHSLAIPPVVEKTKGVNCPCSICITRWLYILFFPSHDLNTFFPGICCC